MLLRRKFLKSALAILMVSLAFFVPWKSSVGASADTSSVLRTPSPRLKFATSGNATVLKPEALLRADQLVRRLNLQPVSRSPFLQVFSSEDYDRTLFISVRTLSSENSHRFFRHPEGVFIQTDLADQTVGLFFSGFEANEVMTVLRDFRSQYSASVPTAISPKTSREPASEVVGSARDGNRADSVQGSAPATYVDQVVESFVGCGLAPARAFNAVTVDPLYGAYKNATAWKEMSFEKHWSLIKRDYNQFVEGFKLHADFLVRGYDRFMELPTKEKSAFVCSVILGGGGGAVAAKAVSKSTQSGKAIAETTTKSPQRAARPRPITEKGAAEKPPIDFELPKNAMNPKDGDPGVTVQVIDLPDSDFARLYNDQSPAYKIIKAKEPPPTPVAPVPSGTQAWFTSVVKLPDGFTESIVYQVLEVKKASGKILIQFMNPLDRGVWQKKEFTPAELRTGFRALEKPPAGLEAAPAL